MTDFLLSAMRLGIAAILAYAGYAKIREFEPLRQTLSSLRIPFDRAIARALPLVELVIAASLLVPVVSKIAALAATALFIVFSVVLTTARVRRVDAMCACFGTRHAERIGGKTILRSSLIAVASAVTVVHGNEGIAGLGWRIGALPAALVILPWVGLVGLSITTFVLLRRYGVALTRIEHLSSMGSAQSPTDVHEGGRRNALGAGRSMDIMSKVQRPLHHVDGTLVQFTRPGGTLVIFTDSKCPSCSELYPHLEISSDRLPAIIFVAGEPEEVKRLAAAHSLESEMVVDRRAQFAISCGVIGVPTGILIDSLGAEVSSPLLGLDAILGALPPPVKEGVRP